MIITPNFDILHTTHDYLLWWNLDDRILAAFVRGQGRMCGVRERIRCYSRSSEHTRYRQHLPTNTGDRCVRPLQKLASSR